MTTFTAVDLSQLPAPQVVDTISYNDILAAMLADLQSRDPSFSALVESDPAYKVLEVAAYREVLVRQRVNEAAKAVMLAYATGNDLDNLGALMNVSRLIVTPADNSTIPPTPAVYESDAAYKARIQQAPEGFSVAGPQGAYVWQARSADGQVLDASAISPSAGNVTVSILANSGDGTADSTLISTVQLALSADSVRPLTDNVTVQAATISNYQITATLYFYSGPDRSVVLAQAQAAAQAYADSMHRIGLDITLDGVYAALRQPGVARVDLTSPAANITIDNQTASYCTAINLTDGGVISG